MYQEDIQNMLFHQEMLDRYQVDRYYMMMMNLKVVMLQHYIRCILRNGYDLYSFQLDIQNIQFVLINLDMFLVDNFDMYLDQEMQNMYQEDIDHIVQHLYEEYIFQDYN